MNEFEEKDYAGARGYADGIKTIADIIMGIFDDIDGVMNSLFGDNWDSSGSQGAHERYNQIRQNYEVFYNQVVAMKKHIYNVTAANEEADAAASRNFESV